MQVAFFSALSRSRPEQKRGPFYIAAKMSSQERTEVLLDAEAELEKCFMALGPWP